MGKKLCIIHYNSDLIHSIYLSTSVNTPGVVLPQVDGPKLTTPTTVHLKN